MDGLPARELSLARSSHPGAAFRALEPFSTGAQYVNFPGLYEDGEQMVQDTFGSNMGRLQALKKRYDPTNLFRLNHNIPPS